MSWVEVFIRRPVMTLLLNVAVVLAGAFAIGKLPVSALPSYDAPVIKVSAWLAGAAPQTMASSVAMPLERELSTIAGLVSISSVNTPGSTSLSLEFDPARSADAVAVDVQAALFRVRGSLPSEMTIPPTYRKVNPADAPVLLLAMTSPSLDITELNAYAEDLLAPAMSSIPGVAQVAIYGQRRFAVRVKVDLQALAARNLTLEELRTLIARANTDTPLGVLEGPRQTLTLRANEQMTSASEWGNIVIASKNGASVRLRDVAEVQDSVESIKNFAALNGTPSITLAVLRQPNTNTIEIVDRVKDALPTLTRQLPASVQLTPVNDRSQWIRHSVRDVKFTLGLTIALVVLVIFLFLRRLAATAIPALSLPVSLLGAMAALYVSGYSLDNISLLGLTLAVGLVVDDAIIVLENIVRHAEGGASPMTAAIRGTREVSFTVISISASLVAVFVPIFFMPGALGFMFREFAVVVGFSILMSALVSLTLVPMLCSRYLSVEKPADSALGALFERAFASVLRGYARSLDWALSHPRWIGAVGLASLALTAILLVSLPKDFFPQEDIGQITVNTEAAPDVSFETMLDLQSRVASQIQNDPSVQTVTWFTGIGGSLATQNLGRLFVVLKPRGDRPPMKQVLQDLRKRTAEVPGIAVFMRPVQNLQLGSRPSKSHYQLTLQSVSTGDLDEWAGKLIQKLRLEPLLRDVTSDSQAQALQASVFIDRDKAGALGVQVADVRNAIHSAFGERSIATIFGAANSFPVILEAADGDRQFEDGLDRIYLRSTTGALVPLQSLASVTRTMGPTAVNHQGQLQAVTLSFNLAPDTALGDATKRIDEVIAELQLPPSVITRYAGDAAALQASYFTQVWLIIGAVLAIYVLLGMLYESLLHPLTILAGLPAAAAGGLLMLYLTGKPLTMIATIGLLMLIGIVKKNAIMMIDFALDAQRRLGQRAPDAIREACLLRLRPILMTTLAALMGALPLALGLGEGGELRQPLGLTVVGGLLVSQGVTLYITPVIYLFLERWANTGALSTAGPVVSSAEADG